MGNHPDKPLLEAARALLKQKELKVPDRVLQNFLKEVDRVAPWFVLSGSLTEGSWTKLGGDLTREKEQGTLKPGVWPLYKLFKSCIKDEKCKEKIKEGQRVLSDHQDSVSEAEKGKEANKRKKPSKKKEKKSHENKDVLTKLAKLEERAAQLAKKEEELEDKAKRLQLLPTPQKKKKKMRMKNLNYIRSSLSSKIALYHLLLKGRMSRSHLTLRSRVLTLLSRQS
ncbi:uncharacterized protein LOC129672912 [Psammomys obesus]|uniref:uncharacterized protein LOC129672912 n=1 Tax=Psammomys obesus TaxID=48139 RepID=UPI002452BA2E|nr:uncharacterized protein LOC129672912 [Psammomys obesus]